MNLGCQCGRHTALDQCTGPTHPGISSALLVCELTFDSFARQDHLFEGDRGC